MRVALVLAAVLAVSCGSTPADPSASTTVSLGVVNSHDGQPIAGALVSAQDQHVTTSDAGYVTLVVSRDAWITVDISAPHFAARHEPYRFHASFAETTIALDPQ